MQTLEINDGAGRPVVLTPDRYGANATVLKGELGRFDNIPILVSDFARDDYETNGYYDGAGAKDRTSMQLTWTEAIRIGTRRDIRIETDRNILAQQNAMIAVWRGDIQKVFPATETTETELINLPVS